LILFFPEAIFPIIYGSYSFVKKFLIFLKFFGFIIRQKPTPQLNVLNISLSFILFSLSQLNIFLVLILFKFISAVNPSGITLFILSARPPPVILAQPLIRLYLIKFKISFT